MNSFARRNEKAFTLTELLVVLAVIGVLALLPISALAISKSASVRLNCVSNLKQVGLAFRLWADKHGDRYPMRVTSNDGGVFGYTTSTFAAQANPSVNTWRVFQCMSNELSTPKVLYCPAEFDAFVSPATIWSGVGGTTYSGNGNLSFFVGVDADPTNPRMLLSGDHNMGSATAGNDNLPAVTTAIWGIGPAQALSTSTGTTTNNPSAAWGDNGHRKQGNVVLSDGSVQQLTIAKLREALRNSGDTNPGGSGPNRLSFP